MKTTKIIYTVIVCIVIAVGGLSAYASDDEVGKDEATVLGTCMIQKIKEKAPEIKNEQISKCSDGDATEAPRCLGINDTDFINIANFCKSQLANAKCVANKMKVSLYDYADCGYQKNPDACYQSLGFTVQQIMKLSSDCAAEESV